MDFLMIKLIIFLLATGLLAWFTRRSIAAPKSHGLFRFLSFESVLALILTNFEYWLSSPFSALQIVSWLLLTTSTVLGLCGFRVLIQKGNPSRSRSDSTLIGFERTTRLVTSGVYRYIRHPLYSTLLLLGWGAFFKHVSPVSSTLVLIASLFLYLTAKREELENIQYFGNDYLAYMKRSKMFIPFLF